MTHNPAHDHLYVCPCLHFVLNCCRLGDNCVAAGEVLTSIVLTGDL